MPLPLNGAFPLQGYSRPGEALLSKPKQAMVVRMSPEIFKALEAFPSNPPMEFQFGDAPGIYIGNSFYPMTTAPAENLEIYLRASSATKKSPPFKLHANVVGKFAVQRDDFDSVGEKLRERKYEAENERTSRATIRLDAPPSISASTQAKPKKKREPTTNSSMFRKPIAPSSRPPEAAPPRAAPKPAPAPPPALTPEQASQFRNRLVHCLASENRSETDAAKAVGGPNCNARTMQVVSQMLQEIGELVDRKSNVYRLKPECWTEVRPYEFKKWSEVDRARICAEAHKQLKALGIPESDPRWSHITSPRSTPPPPPPKKLPPPPPPPTQSLSSSSTTRKTAPSDRDDRRIPKKRVDPPSDSRHRQAGSSKTSVKSESTHTDSRQRLSSANDHDYSRDSVKPGTSSSSARKHPSLKSHTGTEANGRIPSSQRNTSSKVPPREHTSSSTHQLSKFSQRQRYRGDESNADSDIERRPKQRAVNRDPVMPVSRKEREDGEYSDTSVSLSLKRKAQKLDRDSDLDSRHSSIPQKKRRTDSISSLNTQRPKVEENDRDYLRPPPRASDYGQQPSRSKGIKREPSPLAPPVRERYRPSSPLPKQPITSTTDRPIKNSSSNPSQTSSNGNTSKASKSSTTNGNKQRRPPVYTSSEEDDELPQASSSKVRSQQTVPPSHKPAVAPPPRPPPPQTQVPTPAHSLAVTPSTQPSSHSQPRQSKSRPTSNTDRPSLRSRYNASYAEYMGTFYKLAVQRKKIEDLLKEREAKNSGSMTDSEGDADIMSTDELAQLTADHKQHHEELLSIRRAFEKSSEGTGGSSD